MSVLLSGWGVMSLADLTTSKADAVMVWGLDRRLASRKSRSLLQKDALVRA